MSEIIERVETALTHAFERQGRVFDDGQAAILARAAIEEMREPTLEGQRCTMKEIVFALRRWLETHPLRRSGDTPRPKLVLEYPDNGAAYEARSRFMQDASRELVAVMPGPEGGIEIEGIEIEFRGPMRQVTVRGYF